MALTKPCNRCGETKPMDDFARSGHRQDGRAKRCRICSNAYSRSRTAANNAKGLTARGDIPAAILPRRVIGRTGPEDRPIQYAEMQRRWEAKAAGVWFGPNTNVGFDLSFSAHSNTGCESQRRA